jgi:multicomponent Na+:H+ antiporter subunit D
METISSLRPLWAILISLSITPVLISSKNENIREGWTFVAAVIKFLLVASMVPAILRGEEFAYTIAHVLPGVSFALRVDAFGLLFALVSSSLWIITSIYSIGYMRELKEHSQTRYFCFFAISLSATIGVAFSANLFTMYLFYEMLSFATYPLVTHHQDEEARKSGRKYLTYIVGTSIGLVLPAMVIIYLMTGTLEFSDQGVLSPATSKTVVTFLLAAFVFGFAKAGVMPLHSWLPAAMVAPTPVSSLLHAVAVVKVGVFSIFRAVTGILGTDMLASLNLGTVVATVASVTIITASLIALTQDNLKRRLAFSTVGQLSYIVLGAGLLSQKSMVGGMLHIAMHAFGKITLFFCAGAIFVATGKKYVSQLEGIGHRMPITMLAFFIGSLSIIGIPPTGGFYSKWYLLLGTIEAGQWPFLIVLLASSLLSAAYFLPIVYSAFFKEPAEAFQGMSEAPVWCLAPPVITAFCSLVLFFYPDVFLKLAWLALGR